MRRRPDCILIYGVGIRRTLRIPDTRELPVSGSDFPLWRIQTCGRRTYSGVLRSVSMQAYIFRFVSILGERYSHGHVYDFYKQLIEHPDSLYILGNGRQRKSYLYVQDCLDAMLLAIEKAAGQVNIFNLGADECCEVDCSAGWICEYLGLNPKFIHAGGERGWVGDSPFIFLDCSSIRALGWTPQLRIRDAVIRTATYLKDNQWLLSAQTGSAPEEDRSAVAAIGAS